MLHDRLLLEQSPKAIAGRLIRFARSKHLLPAEVLLVDRRHLRFASIHAYIAAIDLKFWHKTLREAEGELDPRARARRWMPPRRSSCVPRPS
jgi:hypothetical protein